MSTTTPTAPRLDDATIDRLGEEIASAAVHADTAVHDLLTRIRAFDAADGWGRQGASSCAHGLSWRVGLDLVTARDKVRVARALGGLPRIDEAFRTGRLSYSKVRAVTRVATSETEEALLEFALASTGSQLEIICRRFRGVLREVTCAQPVTEPERYVRHRPTDCGMVRLEAQLNADEAALVLKAIEAARLLGGAPVEARVDASAESRRSGEAAASSATRAPALPTAADGLVTVAESFLAGGSVPARRRPCFEVTVLVEQATLKGESDAPAVVGRDLAVTAETARRLACDAAVVEATVGGSGELLDMGRRTRTIPPSLRRALLLRDGGCRFPGCTNHLFVDGHHVRHWAAGGPTTLANVLTLCRFHHLLVPEGGFRVVIEEHGPVFFRPDGRRIDPVPPAPASSASPVVARATPRPPPPWDGEVVDYGVAVEALVERAVAGRSGIAREAG